MVKRKRLGCKDYLSHIYGIAVMLGRKEREAG